MGTERIKKRRESSDAGDDDDGPSPSSRGKGGASIGQQTSNIKNKQVRGELYSKLKHKQKVGWLVRDELLRMHAVMGD